MNILRSYLNLLAHHSLRKQVATMCFIWFLSFSIYYSINFDLMYQQDHQFQQGVFLGCAEFIGILLSGYIRLRFSIKKIFICCLVPMCCLNFALFYMDVHHVCSS